MVNSNNEIATGTCGRVSCYIFMLPQRSIIRTRYLTPFKILILILIDHFSRNLIPFETGPKLISLLLDYIQVGILPFVHANKVYAHSWLVDM